MTKSNTLTIRKPYDPSPRVSISSFEKTLAMQEFADECDINTIMSRYENDGILDHVNNFQGSYGDFTNAQDYQTSLNQVIQAEAAFMDLPANIRARFGNDPAQLIGFLESDRAEDIEESVKLGLRVAQEPPSTPEPKGPEKARQEASEKPTDSSAA